MQNRLNANWPLTAGRIIGFIVSIISLGFFLLGLIGGNGTGIVPSDAGGALLASLAALALASCILSYWRVRLAGILLVLISIAFGVYIGQYAIDNQFFAWVILGFPYLVAGALLILAWWMGRKRVAAL